MWLEPSKERKEMQQRQWGPRSCGPWRPLSHLTQSDENHWRAESKQVSGAASVWVVAWTRRFWWKS